MTGTRSSSASQCACVSATSSNRSQSTRATSAVSPARASRRAVSLAVPSTAAAASRPSLAPEVTQHRLKRHACMLADTLQGELIVATDRNERVSALEDARACRLGGLSSRFHLVATLGGGHLVIFLGMSGTHTNIHVSLIHAKLGLRKTQPTQAHFGGWKKPKTRQAEPGRSRTNYVCGSKRCPSGHLIAGCGWLAAGCGESGGDPGDPAGELAEDGNAGGTGGQQPATSVNASGAAGQQSATWRRRRKSGWRFRWGFGWRSGRYEIAWCWRRLP